MKKKKFTGLLLACLMCAVTVFTGCALVTRNWDKYYNTIVATVTTADGSNFDITKRELVNAYSSYGYYYEQYYGNTKKEAVESTLVQLENRKIMLKAAEDKFTEQDGAVLNDKEKTYLWQQTNKSFEQNLLSYLDEEEEDQQEESTDDSVTVEDFEKQAKIVPVYKTVDGQSVVDYYRIEKTTTQTKLLSDFDYDPADKKDCTDDEDKLAIYDNLVDFVLSIKDDTYLDALRAYRRALQSSEQGLKFEDKSTKAMFLREIDRIYTVTYENFLLEKYSESLKSEYDPNLSDVTTQAMLNLYINKVLSSYNKYAASTSYEDDVLSDLSKIDYFKTGDSSTKFYTVCHILIKFGDGQAETYKQAKALENKEPEKAAALMAQLSTEALTPIVREQQPEPNSNVYKETDKRTSDEKNVKTLYDYISGEIKKLDDDKGAGRSMASSIAMAEKFREFIYKYNEDPGIMNAEYNYVMGLNKAQAASAAEDEIVKVTVGGNEIAYKSYSKMVPEFTQAGAELYADGNGQIGDISEAIMTENGYHILMYTGACENYFNDSIIENYKRGDDINLGIGAIETLFNARLNVCTNKTIFDVLYGELTKDNFSTFESKNSQTLRDECKEIKEFEYAYKDLF